MKKISLLVLLITSVTFAQNWGKNKVQGNGKVQSQIKTTTQYDEISCSGPFSVQLIADKEGKIEIEGDENLLNLIIVEVENDKLKVSIEKGTWFDMRGDKIKITIPIEKISRIEFGGSGDLKTRDKIVTENLEIYLSGSGSIDATTNAVALKTVLSGSGTIDLKGTTENFDAKLSGSGRIVCKKLNSQNTIALLSGSGSIDLNCTKSLNAKISGSGTINYSGNPTNVIKKVSGSGEIIRM